VANLAEDISLIDRRSVYQSTSSREQFIVPLLRGKIDAALLDYAAPLGPGRKLLDIGCGEQPLRSTVEGMGFAYASADIQQNKPGTVDFVAAIDQPLPTPLKERGPFDFIVCTEVMEHVADWEMAFANLRQLLAENGRVLITCPHFYPLHEQPHDFWRPTPYALQFFAARHGLKILNQQAAGDGLELIATALACVEPVARSASVLSRCAAWLCDFSRMAAFVLLRSRWLRNNVQGKSDLYLSNIVVLERSELNKS
jgi:2-polyprenyl-3-methyl-5-hydroxy-6-metoxy-1,4-benzoquinol methylase